MTKTIERECSMQDEKALAPIEEQTVDFYGDHITIALVDIDGHTMNYIPLRPICEYLGLSWSGQRERTMRDPVLSTEVALVRVTRTTATGGIPDSLCLPVEFLNGWLFGINASRVKAELREKVIRYQRDCYRVLWDAFNPQPLSVQDTEHPQATTILEQIRATALAVAQLAEQQLQMEQHLTKRLDKAAEVFISFEHRLGTLEKKLSPAALITDEQAETIASTVKALAELMTSRDSGKNHYQGIFSELYRRFGVSSYKNIRLDRYEQVLSFLSDWHQSAKQ
jgi:hypothetical protein